MNVKGPNLVGGVRGGFSEDTKKSRPKGQGKKAGRELGQRACHARQMEQHVPTTLKWKEASISPEEATKKTQAGGGGAQQESMRQARLARQGPAAVLQICNSILTAMENHLSFMQGNNMITLETLEDRSSGCMTSNQRVGEWGPVRKL